MCKRETCKVEQLETLSFKLVVHFGALFFFKFQLAIVERGARFLFDRAAGFHSKSVNSFPGKKKFLALELGFSFERRPVRLVWSIAMCHLLVFQVARSTLRDVGQSNILQASLILGT